jgi:phage terminase large subunit-like protein
MATPSIQVVLAKYLNVEIGLRLRRDRWRGAPYWEAAGDPTLTLESLLERAEVAVVGIDGGGLDDLYGLCVAGRERGRGRWLYWFKAWAWPDALQRRKSIASALKGFEKDGDLVICQSAAPDGSRRRGRRTRDAAGHREIVEIVVQVRDSGLMPENAAVAVDPHGVGDLTDAFAAAGLTIGDGSKGQVVAMGQGYRLMSAVVGLARKLKFRGARPQRLPDDGVGRRQRQRGKRQAIGHDRQGRERHREDRPAGRRPQRHKLLEAIRRPPAGVREWLKSLKNAA